MEWESPDQSTALPPKFQNGHTQCRHRSPYTRLVRKDKAISTAAVTRRSVRNGWRAGGTITKEPGNSGDNGFVHILDCSGLR